MSKENTTRTEFLSVYVQYELPNCEKKTLEGPETRNSGFLSLYILLNFVLFYSESESCSPS